MSRLGEDIKKLATDAITKKDINAAFKLMGEVTGGLAVFSLAAAALTVWIPGWGIPISATMARILFKKMADSYCDLPMEQRTVIAKCAKWLQGIIR